MACDRRPRYLSLFKASLSFSRIGKLVGIRRIVIEKTRSIRKVVLLDRSAISFRLHRDLAVFYSGFATSSSASSPLRLGRVEGAVPSFLAGVDDLLADGSRPWPNDVHQSDAKSRKRRPWFS
jgi:hypothetical protein